jgi:nanoRNase/pAp phosphatase (c-di-AMP/oligoRNAs hydrolase)
MKDEKKKYGLVTRSDMDGLVCAVLLKQLGLIDDITFVHPKDVQDGKIDINENHITTNLPYNASEAIRIKVVRPNRINQPAAPSAARVVYDYFGGKEVFPKISAEMMTAVDKADSAQFSLADVLSPQGWVLLSFLMDARTGLGRFQNFRISNYQLMMDLIDYCLEHSIEEILALPDIRERTHLFFDLHKQFQDQVKRCSSIYDKLVVLDLRHEETIFPGNRFMVYALFPQSTVSIHILWGVKKQNTVFAMGKSIFDRSSIINIGKLMLEYGGGGHESAGTCQIPNEKAEKVKEELINRITIENR